MPAQKDPQQTPTGKVSSPTPTRAIEPARLNYRALLLANPNHFGNLEQSLFKPVQALSLDTRYEQLVCLGLDTDFDRLEAVIEIKLDSGYEGAICSAGSHEYVRFYADLRNDGVWVDLGTASVNVHDIPGDKPLCYAVSLDFTPFRKLCLSENVIAVRAILSWSVAPPANTPGFTPVWGNSLTVEVQIRPRTWLIFPELPEPAKATASQLATLALIDPAATLPLKPPATLSVAAKAALYKDQDVPAHRFAFAEAQALLGAPALPPYTLASGGPSPLAALGLSATQAAELAGKLVSVNGDTTYEELRCAGLRTDSDMLEGVLTIKRNAGYSGQLCTSGSREYVAFWMDFGAGFVYVGTGSVGVHDLSTVPSQGLQYAVFAKCDLSRWTVPCAKGPRIVRLRAILSWATPPPAGDPDYVPVWGNRVECNVQLRPGIPAGQPLIETVGNVDVSNIDPVTGLATGPGVGATFTAYRSPFGGSIQITGRIGNPPVFSPSTKLRYRIEAVPPGGGSWQPITTTPLTVAYSQSSAGMPVQCGPGDSVCTRTLVPGNDGDGLGDGWLDYIEDFQSPTETWLVQDLLASWQTGPGQEGLWQLRMAVKDMSVPSGPRQAVYGPQIIAVQVDNTAPTVDLALTGATFDGQPIPAAACGRFPVGAKLSGTFAVSDPGTTSPDQHFGQFNFGLLPAGPADGAAVQPAAGTFPPILTTGESGTWTLDTSAMQPCGFVLRLSATDRTVYNSAFVGLFNFADVGFCLLASPQAG